MLFSFRNSWRLAGLLREELEKVSKQLAEQRALVATLEVEITTVLQEKKIQELDYKSHVQQYGIRPTDFLRYELMFEVCKNLFLIKIVKGLWHRLEDKVARLKQRLRGYTGVKLLNFYLCMQYYLLQNVKIPQSQALTNPTTGTF